MNKLWHQIRETDGYDVAVRAAKTAVQTFIAVLIADQAEIFDLSVLHAATAAALASGLSVVQNSLGPN